MDEDLRKQMAEHLINFAASAAHLSDEDMNKMMKMSLDKMPGIPQEQKDAIFEMIKQQLIPIRAKQKEEQTKQ